MAKLIIICASLGYLDAAIFYSPYIGINAQTQLVCPFCPHVLTSWSTPTMRFLRFTAVGGTIKAALFAVLGYVVAKFGKRETPQNRFY